MNQQEEHHKDASGRRLTNRDLQALSMRSRLLETAVSLIIERGYDAISISEICRKAKTSKANFYTHFPSKREIVREILSEVNRKMFAHLDTREDADVSTRLKAYASAYLDTIQSQGNGFTSVALKIMMDEDFDVSDVYADMHGSLVHGVIGRGIERGEVPVDYDQEKFAWKLQTLIYGIMVDWCFRPVADIRVKAWPFISEFIDSEFANNQSKNI